MNAGRCRDQGTVDVTNINDWHETDRLHAEQGQGDPFAAAVRATRMAMIITDPRQHDNPIVFANAAFLKLTGYDRDEVLGANCRFLQGEKTDRVAVATIRAAIERRSDVSIDILNYRKSGEPFWNGLYMSPVINAAGELQFFFASQLDVTDRVSAQQQITTQREWLEREVSRRTEELSEALAAQTMLVHEVDHRVKNNIQMISALLSMQTTAIPDPAIRATLASMLQRVEAIGAVHRRLYQSEDVRRFDLTEFIRDICDELIKVSGRDDIAVIFDLQTVRVPATQASPIALMLNELLMNALKHAFPVGRTGQLRITVRETQHYLQVEIADDGVGMSSTAPRNGFGSRMIRTLARQLQAEVLWSAGDAGTIVELRLPIHPASQVRAHA
ncbi:Histidine kinase [Beijerinckiaceae bacterium RH AL1]|nr:Histidine kinase [Beijerinckiaceae bacterium RH CH11]VVB44596.1 Histidine kinase [Beijerinckiaceae bacterium RH AL8]VVC54396.1 Histidine kinase [Beijerinckiaceae bacterium RH AL1]